MVKRKKSGNENIFPHLDQRKLWEEFLTKKSKESQRNGNNTIPRTADEMVADLFAGDLIDSVTSSFRFFYDSKILLSCGLLLLVVFQPEEIHLYKTNSPKKESFVNMFSTRRVSKTIGKANFTQ